MKTTVELPHELQVRAKKRGAAAAPDRSAETILRVKSRAAWRSWLRRRHASSAGVRLVVSKKGSRAPGVTYEEAVREALCFGWIDSKPGTLDAESFLLWIAPRRPGSVWSRINKERVRALVKAKLMAPSGMAKVAAARKDGSWDRLVGIDALRVPADFRAALARIPAAKRNFDAFPASSKKIILFWIDSARRPETRARRVREAVEMAERDLRANHFRQKKAPPRGGA